MQKALPVPADEVNTELLRTGRRDGDLTGKKRDGPRVVVAGRWSLQRDSQGRPAAVLEANNDITEREQAEESLQQAQANLERLSRLMLLSAMTASIAHEVNQTTAAIVAKGGTRLRWLAARPPPRH